MKKKYKNLEKVALKFTQIMIRRVQEINDDWEKPWFPVVRKNFFPQNITGRRYSGGNIIMLLFYMMFTDFKTPVFLTFRQAKERDIHIRKGVSSFPVYYFTYVYCNSNTKERISEAEYEKLPEWEQNDYYILPMAKYFDVFNLDQTNFAEKYPGQWEELLNGFEERVKLNTDENIFSFPLLDDVFREKTWVCPIELTKSNRAYYSPSQDRIVLPLKEQFKIGQAFYSTALHEMTHSTGSQERLKRIKSGSSKGSDDYAREELVAELSAALSGYYMGIETYPDKENAAYLKYWISQLNEEPDYLLDVLGDVVRAVSYILEKIGFVIPDNNPQSPKEIKNSNVPTNNDNLVIVD